MHSSRANLNPKNTKEELIIYELVESISLLQQKIANLIQSMEHTSSNELYLKFSLIEDDIIKNKKTINNLIGELKRNEINLKRMKSNNELIVNKIEYDFDDINKRINNIVQGGKKNDKEIYRISKDNIAKIILEKKNESKLRNLNIDYNSLIIEYQNLLNVLEVNINKKYQLDEKLNMLKEEKKVMGGKVIENISKKESFEEVSKIYLLKFINEIFYKNVTESRNDNNFELSNGAHSLLLNNKNYGANNNFNISNENLIIYSYELNNININKLCYEIAIQLISSINNCLKNNNSNSNNNKSENNLNTNNNPLIDSKIIYNSKENISLIEIMSSKVKKEILNFIKYLNENNNFDFQNSINDFFFELSKSTIKYLNYFFNSQLKIKEENIFLLIYLKLLFKKFYLDNVIQNELDFLNKQYKKNKKNIKKCIELTLANIHKLNEKKKKYDIKLNDIKQKKQMSQEKNISDKVHVSLKDKAYFDLTKKSNDIIQNKEDINNDFDSIEKEYQLRNENLNRSILNKEKEIKILENNKKIIEEKMAKKNKVIMNEIARLKKIITNKFKLIRAQMDIYKRKYGNNNDLYDKFMNKITRSLRSTSKSMINNNNNNISLNKTHTNFYRKNNLYVTPKNENNDNTFYRSNKNNNSSKNKKTIEPYYSNDYRPFSKDDIYYYNKY